MNILFGLLLIILGIAIGELHARPELRKKLDAKLRGKKAKKTTKNK
jgi:hypothetical protein